jgi:hypothetical protein
MSGPMAAGFGIEAAVLISAQSIINGAAEIAAGMSEAERDAAAQREQRRVERRQRKAASATGLHQRQQDIAAHQQLAQLTRLLNVLDPAAATALAQRTAELATAAGDELATSLTQQLATHLAAAQARAATDRTAARRAVVAHALERLQLAAATPLPDALLALAQQVVDAPSDNRADALATELRYQVQQHQEARAAAIAQQQRQAAAAIVLEQSLKDLGYAVEDIDETLFIDGGIAHFQQTGWGDYFIRLRLDPQRNTMNFNVVRAGTPADDRRHEDMLAEERWCSEFPKLFDTLKTRGIPITVTRLLQAGEAPVQVVDAASLPERVTEERQHTPLKSRSLE